MRLTITFFGFCLMFQQAFVLAASPIVASVIVPQTEARSGPDASFYPTSLLRFGDEVEIYFESNNWFAIRPPLGSFSWVGAGHVSVMSGNIGVVLADGLASRVGSEITDSCDTVQVKLKRGEKILVWGKKETPQNSASPIWFKISPPNGEYRWIPRGAIDPNFRNENVVAISQNKILTAEYSTKPSDLQDYSLVLYEEIKPATNITTPTNQNPPLLLPPSDSEPTATPNTPNANKTADIIGSAGSDAAKKVVSNSANPNVNSVPLTAARLRFDNNNESVILPSVVSSANVLRSRVGNGTNWNFQRIFEELQSETVSALTGATDDWIFVTLIEEANRLYNSADNDNDMEKVYHIIESLKRGRAVRQDIVNRRQLNTNQTTPQTINPTQTTTTRPSSPNTAANILPAAVLPDKTEPVTSNSTAVANDSVKQFDISGKLGIFVSPPSKYPPFAVVDGGGRIICLLTPEAGADLRQYVGKIVGINGIRGIYRKSGQPDSQHITVKTIAIIR
ncbi:MAG: hypothetical protein LBJ00_14190 [Planctomycetaceae bacterium]|jgi:hypothetical protein|nr:hypothetical protein [Planctomycetaceae bacterium]